MPIDVNSATPREDDDDFEGAYRLSREIAHEVHSPAVENLRRHGAVKVDEGGDFLSSLMFGSTAEAAEGPASPAGLRRGKPFPDPEMAEAYRAEQRAQGVPEEEIEQELTRQVEDPWLDPLPAAVSGGGSAAVLGIRAGAKLLPMLARTLTSALVSGAADYPIGLATEKVGEKHPRLALPFNILTGLVSGMSVERALEDGVTRYFAGKGTRVSSRLLKDTVAQVRKELEAGEVMTAPAQMIVKDLNARWGFVPRPGTESYDFGTVGEEIAGAIERQAAPIRLTADAVEHIAGRPERLEEIEALGYAGVEDFVADVAENFTQVYQGAGRSLILAKKNKAAQTAFIELVPDPDGDFYNVKSAIPRTRADYFNEKNMLWDGAQSRQPSPEGPPPSAISGQSIEGSVGEGAGEVKAIPTGEFAPTRPAEPEGVKPPGYEGQRGEDEAARKAKILAVVGDSNRPLVEILDQVDAAKAAEFLGAKVPQPAGKAININFAHLNTSEEIQEVLSKTAEVFGGGIQAARRGVVSNEETARLADEMGLSVQQLLSRRAGQAFNAHEALAARSLLLESARRLQEQASRIAAADATDLDKAAFRKQLALHYAIQAQVSGMTAEAARALQAFRITAQESTGQVKQIRELMQHMDRHAPTEDLAAMIVTLDSPAALNRFAKDAQKATGWDMLFEAWINGLLSGPVTHAVNMTSNLLTAVYQVPERMLAAGIGKVWRGEQEIVAREALEQAYGLVEGFKDGLKLFGKAVRSGEASDLFTKAEMPRRQAITAENLRETLVGRAARKLSSDALEEGGVAARAVNLFGAGVNMPGRMLTAEDELFKSVGYRMELRARALRLSRAEGLTGEAQARRIEELIAAPPDDLHLAAIDYARYQTFTQELGKTGKALQNLIAKAPALRLIVPFVQTPTNIVKFWYQRTPFRALELLKGRNGALWQDIQAGGARRDLALARMSLGFMVMAATGTMAAAGYITGGGPPDPAMRQQKRNTGWQPYSIRIGDKYYAYNRLEPLGMLLGVAADAAEILPHLGEEEASSLATAAVLAIGKNVTSKTWLEGVSNALQALEDPERYGPQFLQSFARTLIPRAVAQIEREVDPELRSTEPTDRTGGLWQEIVNAVKADIPGLSDNLPPRRNFWGEAIVPEGGVGPDFLSPIYTSTGRSSPIDEELLRLDRPQRMPRNVQGFPSEAGSVPVPLNAREYDRFMVLMNTIELQSTGMPLKESLDAMVTKDALYAGASDDEKERAIRRAISEAQDLAKQRLFEESPELQYLIRSFAEKRIYQQ